MSNPTTFEDLKGRTLVAVEGLSPQSTAVRFLTDGGWVCKLYHRQDCCEEVRLEDFEGEPQDLLGAPIGLAEEVRHNQRADKDYGTATWTFYKLSTPKGHLTLRWLGKSNGYYSEAVDIAWEGVPDGTSSED